MKIKRFKATDMRDAMMQIEEEFGEEAVILETHRDDDGVEVSAAIDYDPSVFATEHAAPGPGTRIDCTDADAESCVTLGAESTGEAWRPLADDVQGPAEAAGPGMRQISEEVRSIRCLLEAQLSRLIWDEQSRRTPEAASVMQNFSNLGLTPDIVERLVGSMGDLRGLENMWTRPLAHLAQNIPTCDEDRICEGGIFAIVGPTGVGKTTTIAKLAARYALRKHPQDIALVSMDSFRIAAREQLETFGQILGAPVYCASDAAELGNTLRSLADKHLVLIDTAGMGQRDVQLAGQLSALSGTDPAVNVLLALPANAQADALREIVEAFRAAGPSGCILTKIDEATSLGGALSALIRSGLPLAYITNGQRVPEDLHFARPRKTWLIKAALELIRSHPRRRDEHYMARHFGAGSSTEVNIDACA